MTNYGYLAPATGSPATVAGAGAPPAAQQVNAALAALNTAVDALTVQCDSPRYNLYVRECVVSSNPLHSVLTAPVVAAALDGVNTATDLVQQAQSDLSAVVIALYAVPAPAAPTVMSQGNPSGQFIRMGAPWVAGLLYGIIPGASLTSVPDNGGKWFAITRGKYIGFTQNSAISLNAVTGISTGLSEKFGSQADALNHFNRGPPHRFFGGDPVNTPASPPSYETSDDNELNRCSKASASRMPHPTPMSLLHIKARPQLPHDAPTIQLFHPHRNWLYYILGSGLRPDSRCFRHLSTPPHPETQKDGKVWGYAVFCGRATGRLRSSLSCIVPPTAFSKATAPSIMPKPPTNSPSTRVDSDPFRHFRALAKPSNQPQQLPTPIELPESLRISILSTMIRYRLVGM
ncbi:hypothetical protein B0H13DRAFT_2316097 [Mycena leptocephala]|nr:hypothetical protein B0H13DRAFT_2316097 [Mycena leptocephala]